MEKQIQNLEQQVAGLKVRVFDAEESLRQERDGINGVMQQLVSVAKVKGDENGNVTIDAVLQRIAALVTLEEAGEEVEETSAE